MSRQLLNGWKEISRHIGRSVRTVQRWGPRLGMPVYGTTLKNRSVVVAFSDELDRWISRASPTTEEDAVLNNEIVLQILKDMSSLVGNISGLAPQMQLWPELLPQPIEFYHPKTASRMCGSAASVANRGTGLLLVFRPRKAVLHSDSTLFGADVRGLIDEGGSALGLHNSTVNHSNPDLVHRFPAERDQVQEATDAIFLVRDTGQAVTLQVKPDEG
jgi:hypothetical protein